MGTLGWLSHYYSIFPLTLTFTLLASPCWLLAFSYFLTVDIKFSCCFPNEIRLLCFLSLALALIHVSVDKNLAEKIFDFVVYFTLKVGVARVFALKTSSYNRVAIPADWVILQWVRNFCFLRSGPVFFKQWNNLIIRKIFAYEKEDWQGNSRDRKREMCLWWMWWFHEVRWSDLWLLRLFFILKMMTAPPLTLFRDIRKTVHRMREQVKGQIQRSGKIKT